MCVRMGRVEVRVEGDESRMVVTFVSEGRDHPPGFHRSLGHALDFSAPAHRVPQVGLTCFSNLVHSPTPEDNRIEASSAHQSQPLTLASSLRVFVLRLCCMAFIEKDKLLWLKLLQHPTVT